MPDTVNARHRRHALDLELLRGSLITLRRRCGKPNCRCATGEPHESPALSYSHEGRTKTVTLREDDLDQVAAALERYRAARDKVEQDAEAGIEALRVWVAARRERDAGRRGPPRAGRPRGARSSVRSRRRSPAPRSRSSTI